MSTISTNIVERFSKMGISIPEILLPSRGVDISKWSVNACDQYTSDPEYWDKVDSIVHTSPSTLRLTLPEIYLESADVAQRIDGIHRAMTNYLKTGVFDHYPQSMVLVKRSNAHAQSRDGLVLCLDLEYYDYSVDSKTLIRATEGTIVDRIPPRLKVREKAGLELPHIMVLINDPERILIEGLAQRLAISPKIYDVDLMQNGGRLQGTLIHDEKDFSWILEKFELLHAQSKAQQKTDNPLFFAMGDGNHSLATAKAHWEKTKKSLQSGEGTSSLIPDHPARFALVEIVNIHSEGLHFEPIHRVLFGIKKSDFVSKCKSAGVVVSEIDEEGLKKLLASAEGQLRAGFFDGKSFYSLSFANTLLLPPAQIDGLFADIKKEQPSARIDFIHGWQDTKKLAQEDTVSVFLPVIARNRLFEWVGKNGPLPRKAFSMGEADEKRYYMECRIITC